MTTMSTISGDLFSENYQDTSQQDFDANIFLKGLSVSEKQSMVTIIITFMLFQVRSLFCSLLAKKIRSESLFC
jgi:hypothetical protein